MLTLLFNFQLRLRFLLQRVKPLDVSKQEKQDFRNFQKCLLCSYSYFFLYSIPISLLLFISLHGYTPTHCHHKQMCVCIVYCGDRVSATSLSALGQPLIASCPKVSYLLYLSLNKSCILATSKSNTSDLTPYSSLPTARNLLRRWVARS